MMVALKRAWADTLPLFGGWSAMILAALWAAIGFALHSFQAPIPEVQEEWATWLIYGLQAGGVLFVGAFLWNLACAPYRMERDAHERLKNGRGITEQSRNATLAIVKGREYFTLKESANLLVGCAIDTTDSADAESMLYELKEMMRDGLLNRIDSPSPTENLLNLNQMIALSDGRGPMPGGAARISRSDLKVTVKTLSIKVAGL